MTSRSALALMCASMGAAAAVAGCEPTTIYIETAAGGAGGATTSSSTTSSSTTSSMIGGSGGGAGCVPGETQPCYSGPPESAGQGICKAGSQVCATDGSWGPCEGEVLPQEEDCATAQDEDCDGLAPPCKGNLLWAKRFGDGSSQYVTDVAVDAAGNTIVAGYFMGTIDFGDGPLTSGGPSDGFVAMLDTDGATKWSRRIGGLSGAPAFTWPNRVAVDASGNVVVLGEFGGTVDFSGSVLTSTGAQDIFVLKLNAAGAGVWVRSFGKLESWDLPAAGLAIDAADNVVLTGSFGGTLDFGGGAFSSAGYLNVFVAKLDAAGNHVWSKSFADTGEQTAAGVSLDANGNVVLAGSFSTAIDFGGAPLTSAGGRDVFVAKLDASGNHVWSRGFGAANDQTASGVVLDGQGNVLLIGSFLGTIDPGGSSPLVSAGGRDVFLTKLDALGNHLWSKRFGDPSEQTVADVAVDASGSVLLTGALSGVVSFGGSPLASAGGNDIFLVKLDSAGEHVWSARFGGTKDDISQAIAVDTSDNIVLTGYFSGTTDFGAGPMISAGSTDVFVARFSP